MGTEGYRTRLSDKELKLKLTSCGALLIEGAKWCGKTTSARQVARTVRKLDDPKMKSEYESMMRLDPTKVLGGDAPVLLDEWQLIPSLWDAVRFEVDERGARGQFLLTGSAVPPNMSQVHHSGAGRIARMKMRPMSLYESGESTGEVSLAALFAGEKSVSGDRSVSLDELAFLIARGGWPGALDLPEDLALLQARNYYDAIVHADISRVDGVRRSSRQSAALMRSYARLVGTQAKLTKFVADMQTDEAARISTATVASYLGALEKIFVIEESENWAPRLRSRSVMRTSRTRYFTDPSIAVAALGCGPGELSRDLSTMGLLFENMVVRDLRVYAASIDGEVHHFLDRNGTEVDAIVRLHNGAYGIVEIKLGDYQADEAAASLQKFASMVDTQHAPAPAFMMVIVGVGRFAYRRKEDGVFVVPISTLSA